MNNQNIHAAYGAVANFDVSNTMSLIASMVQTLVSVSIVAPTFMPVLLFIIGLIGVVAATNLLYALRVKRIA